MKNLYAALAKAQLDFKEPKRTSKAYNYYYAPMDEVRNAVFEALSKHGLSVIQFPINKEDQVGVKTILAHESGESIEHDFVTRLVKNDPQSIGSVITYYRRYALMACLGLAPEDDDAASAMPPKDGAEARRQEKPRFSINQAEKAQSFIQEKIQEKLFALPGDMLIEFGKYKGKKFSEVARTDLESYLAYLKQVATPTPATNYFIKNLSAYLFSEGGKE